MDGKPEIGREWVYAELDVDPSSTAFQKVANVAFERAARDYGLIFGDIGYKLDVQKNLAVASAFVVGVNQVTAVLVDRIKDAES